MLRRKKKNTYLASLHKAVTPQTTIIAFDLHNVVFKKQTRKIVMQGIRLLSKGTWRYTFSPRLWYRFYKIRAQSDVAEDIFQKVALEYPGLTQFRGDFIRLTNTQKPIPAVMQMIKSLKERGYHLYILSNIGGDTFDELSEIYPELREYFNGAFIAMAHNQYLHKPHLEFYEGFKEFIRGEGHGEKQVVFVDDLKRNLSAAALCQIAGIHFTSPKKLHRAFEHLGVW
jgi:FMN phosphatase YigB (HAD superfamily)